MSYDYDRRVAAVLFREHGDTYEVSGNYNELKGALKALKSQGWRWDGQKRTWSIPKDKLTPRQLANIKKKLGVRDNEAPDAGTYDKVVKGLAHMTLKKVQGGIVVPPVGIDFRVYKGEWLNTEGAWLLGPKIDSKSLLKDLPQIKSAFTATQDVVQRLKTFKSDSLLGVYVAQGRVSLSGPSTYHIKDDLKRMGFRFQGGAWSGILSKVKDPKSFLDLLEKARGTEKAKAQEKNLPKAEQNKMPATDKQKSLLKKLVRKHRSDWFDITDGIGSMHPPSDRDIDDMDRGEASALIDMVLDWNRS